jgi:tetratricopeptide (TPR) repeat protein
LALDILLDLSKKEPIPYEPTIAMILNNLGSIFASQKKYKEALKSYRASLSYYSSLAEKSATTYGHHVATIFKNLASMYIHQNKMKMAKLFHLKSVKVYKVLAEYNEDTYNIELASCLVDGVHYYRQHSLSLYRAEAILKTYVENSRAGELLKQINHLRQSKVSIIN